MAHRDTRIAQALSAAGVSFVKRLDPMTGKQMFCLQPRMAVATKVAANAPTYAARPAVVSTLPVPA